MSKMVKCKTCGEEIAKSAKVCPKCGAKRKRHTFLGIILAILGLLLIMAAVGGNSTSSNNDPSDTTDDIYYAESSGKLVLDKAPEIVKGQYGNLSVDGSIINNSGKDLTYVQITFALYDSDGAQIGTAVANINNLTKDSVWKFSAVPLTMDSFETFELADISLW